MTSLYFSDDADFPVFCAWEIIENAFSNTGYNTIWMKQSAQRYSQDCFWKRKQTMHIAFWSYNWKNAFFLKNKIQKHVLEETFVGGDTHWKTFLAIWISVCLRSVTSTSYQKHWGANWRHKSFRQNETTIFFETFYMWTEQIVFSRKQPVVDVLASAFSSFYLEIKALFK